MLADLSQHTWIQFRFIMASSSFEGKIAIVTGASRGIGREIAIQLVKRGAQGVRLSQYYH